MIFMLEYEEINAKLGFWKYRNLIRDLGENYEECLLAASNIPDWAGLEERMEFARWLHSNVTGGTSEAFAFGKETDGIEYRISAPTDNPF